MLNGIYKERGPWVFLVGWTVLNFFQSGFTGFFHDEAFYWFCSQHLEWGYWYHPPAAPFLIHLGYALSPGIWGARLFIVLASTATLYGVWRLVRPEDNHLFFALAFSVFVVHVGGFMAAPDIPLLLTTVWFLVLYRRYQETDSWAMAAGLGLFTAAMAYSKYHGAVLLLFLLLSNLSLLRRPSFWLIPLLALLLFVPHLYWQWEHGFPTFRYHLIHRAGEQYEWRFVADFLGGQLLIMGPLVSLLLFAAAFRYTSATPFDRSMKWALWGVMVFFFFQSFNQRTEANWTAMAVIPLIYLAYRFILPRPKWRKWLYGLAIPSMLIMAALRLEFAIGYLPEKIFPRKEAIGWEGWANEVDEIAGERPVVFTNTYRLPSYYRFYTGKETHAQSIYGYSGNQFDLMVEEEAALQGRQVVIVSIAVERGTPINPGGKMQTKYQVVDDFRSFNRVKLAPEGIPRSLPRDTVIEARLMIENRSDRLVRFGEGGRKIRLYFLIFQNDRLVLQEEAVDKLLTLELQGREKQSWTVRFRTPAEPGSYQYRFSLQAEGLFLGWNNFFEDLQVE